MFYFGPWDRSGHYLHHEGGRSVRDHERGSLPWHEYSPCNGIDCCLQPGCVWNNGIWKHGPEIEGHALLHHRDGWTALSFWDRSVDTRGGCNSTYFAEGSFSFDEMVALAKERFAYRWNKMSFAVVQVKAT
jgi:hypothetical protein